MSDESPLRVLPLGTGNAFSATRFPTSLLLLADERTVLIDLPDPFFRMCADATRRSGVNVDPADIDDIVLTHLHGDHSNGLEGFGFWKKFMSQGGAAPTLHTSPPAAERLWEKLAPAMAESVDPHDGTVTRRNLEDFYDVRVHEFGSTFNVGPIEFTLRKTRHPVPTFGFLARCGGRTFGYACDTCFDPDHIEFLSQADLIFHETGLGIHTPIADLEALPEATRNKIRLIHLNDDFPGSSKIDLAKEGRVYPV